MRKIFILTCLIIVSCTHQDSTESTVTSTKKGQTISVDIDAAEPIYMSEYFSDIQYSYLKSPEDRPIGRIDKILFNDTYVALYDEPRGSIWIYDTDMAFVNELRIPNGRGPGELENIFDIILSEDHKIHAMGLFKIVVYDINGTLESEIVFNFSSDTFTLAESGGYFVYTSMNPNLGRLDEQKEEHTLISIDDNGNPTNAYLPIDDGKELISFSVVNNFPTYNDEQLFFAHLYDTVYSLTQNSLTPKYQLDYGKYSIPPEVFERRYNYSPEKSFSTEFMNEEIHQKGYIAYLGYFNETDRYLHFGIGIGRSTNYTVIYDKQSKTTRVADDKIINDIDYGLGSYFYEAYDNKLYTVINANDLLTHLNDIYENEPKKYQSSKTNRIHELVQLIDDKRNPILVTLYFKRN